jgi:hypothetical protein
VAFLVVLVSMEEWKKLMRYYESLCNIPNYFGVIEGKRVHIRCRKRVVINYINVRVRGLEINILGTAYMEQISVH